MQVGIFLGREDWLPVKLDRIGIVAYRPQVPSVPNISNPREVWRPRKTRPDEFSQFTAAPRLEHQVDAVVGINRPLTVHP